MATMAQDPTLTNEPLDGCAPAAGLASDQLILLMVSDDPMMPSSRHVLDEVEEVRFGRGPREARRDTVDGRPVLTLRVPDKWMSTEHGRLIRGPDAWILDDPG